MRLKFEVEKIPPKSPKKVANDTPAGIDRWSPDGTGEVRRGTLRVRYSEDSGKFLCSNLTRQAPRWGTANLNRFARSPYPKRTPESEYRRPTAYPGTILAPTRRTPAKVRLMSGEFLSPADKQNLDHPFSPPEITMMQAKLCDFFVFFVFGTS